MLKYAKICTRKRKKKLPRRGNLPIRVIDAGAREGKRDPAQGGGSLDTYFKNRFFSPVFFSLLSFAPFGWCLWFTIIGQLLMVIGGVWPVVLRRGKSVFRVCRENYRLACLGKIARTAQEGRKQGKTGRSASRAADSMAVWVVRGCNGLILACSGCWVVCWFLGVRG